MEAVRYYLHNNSGRAMRVGLTGLAIPFTLGIVALQFLSDLPDPRLAWLLPLCLAGLVFAPRMRMPLAVLIGFLWALWHAAATLDRELAPELQGRDLRLTGVVASLPLERGHRLRFEFDVERLEADGASRPVPGRVRLNWYRDHPPMRVGQRWELTARLKRPHGFMNPGGFDYERWLFERGIRATGYVRGASDHRLLGDAGEARYWLDRKRQALAETMSDALGGRPQAGLISALVLGERGGIGRADWERFTRTGTNHLIAISGLHIGIVAGLVFFLARGIWARAGTLPLLFPAPQAAAVAALIAGIVYAGLAGFAIPTQRALAMLVVVLGGVLARRSIPPGHGLALALVLVLLIDPLAVLSMGFWLSFLAVGVILYAMAGRSAADSPWRKWGRIQWVVGIGLFPVLLATFHQASLIAPLVNLVAVPWFTLVIVPLSLLGALSIILVPALGKPMLIADETFLQWTVKALDGLADTPIALWTQAAPPAWIWIAALLGVMLMLAPRGLPGRWTGTLLLLPMFTAPTPKPAMGEVWVSLLDVGQGLAAVVRTREHALLYDAGARFSAQFDAGDAVVAPFLRQAGVSVLDVMVLSNADNDHAGGAPSVARRVDIGRILSGEPGRIAWSHSEPCRAGEAWEWDGVHFEFLHPPAVPDATPAWRGNDASCVLRVSGPGGSLLLPGDIEARAERRLTGLDTGALRADIVVVPHHGSGTSSSPELVRAVSPGHALFAVGHRNRYGFPIAEIEERWRAGGARLLDTASSGAISFRIHPQTGVEGPASYRKVYRRYWHES